MTVNWNWWTRSILTYRRYGETQQPGRRSRQCSPLKIYNTIIKYCSNKLYLCTLCRPSLCYSKTPLQFQQFSQHIVSQTHFGSQKVSVNMICSSYNWRIDQRSNNHLSLNIIKNTWQYTGQKPRPFELPTANLYRSLGRP